MYAEGASDDLNDKSERQVFKKLQYGNNSSESNAFTSLMKVLNDAENSNLTIAFSDNDQNEFFNTGQHTSERRRIYTKKELVGDSSYYKQGMTNFSCAHVSLQTKIKQMKENCDSKNTNIKDIQLKIQAIKLQEQIESQKVAEAWGNRIKVQILDSNKAKEDLEDLISTVKKDCKKLLAQKKKLNQKLKDTFKSRINYVTAAENHAIQMLDEQHKQWKMKEHHRLMSLTKEKMNEFKREAAEAIEPEIRKAVASNQANIENIRKDSQKEIDVFEKELRLEYDNQFKAKKQQIDEGHSRELESLNEQYCCRYDEIEEKNLLTIKETEMKYRSDIEVILANFGSDKTQRKEKYESELVEEQKTSDILCKETLDSQTKELAKKEIDYNHNITKMMNELEQKQEHVNVCRMKQLKERLDEKLRQEISDMKKKANQDVMRVRIRLNKENEIEMAKASYGHDCNLKATQTSQEDEVVKKKVIEQSMAKKFNNMEKDKHKAQEDLETLKCRLTQQYRTLICLKEEEKNTENILNKMLAKIEQINDGAELQAKSRIQNLTAEIDQTNQKICSMKLDYKEMVALHEREIKTLSDHLEKEKQEAKSKVDIVLNKKNAQLLAKETDFKLYKEKCISIEKKLSERRCILLQSN